MGPWPARGGSDGAGRRRGPSLTGRQPGWRRSKARTLLAEEGFGGGQGIGEILKQ